MFPNCNFFCKAETLAFILILPDWFNIEKLDHAAFASKANKAICQLLSKNAQEKGNFIFCYIANVQFTKHFFVEKEEKKTKIYR